MKYLFVFSDDSIYETDYVVNFKEAVRQTAQHAGDLHNLFFTCLKKFEIDDTENIVDLFNYFSYKSLTKIYTVSEKIYDDRD